MSEPRRDDEPTMEEILASIRKIISEDDPEAAAPAREADGAGDDDESEPMELTQMVSEDGSVVDLRAEPRASLVSIGEDTAEEPADALDDEYAETAIVEPLVPEGTRVHADLVDEEGAIELDAREREAPAGVDEADTAPEIEQDKTNPTPTNAKLDSLVSPAVAAAATAAMSRLKDSLAAGTPVGAGGKTLEALVREAMTPHLKAWLDENLPRLVERIVREEIEKMVERAEHR